MRCGIDQRALVVLTMNLYKRVPELLESLHAYRLIVDKCARASIGKLHAAEYQFIVGGNLIGREKRSHRMVARNLEYRGDLALLDALSHQSLIPAPA